MKKRSSHKGAKALIIIIILIVAAGVTLFMPLEILGNVFPKAAIEKMTEFREYAFELADEIQQRINGDEDKKDEAYVEPISRSNTENESSNDTKNQTSEINTDINQLVSNIEANLSIDNLSFEIGKISEEDIQNIVLLIQAEPEFFWINNHYSYSSTADGNITLMLEAKYSNIEEMQQQIDAAADQIIAEIPDGAGDYEKAEIIYSRLINDITYNHDAAHESDYDIYGALVNKSAVCDGYAKAFKYLFEKAGLSCSYYAGDATNTAGNTEGHAWNGAYLEGELYYFDVTWADQDDGFVHFDWFAVTSEEMLASHMPYEVFKMQDTSATECNYYYRNNMVLYSSDDESVRNLFGEQGYSVNFKCADREVFESFKSIMQDDYTVWSICQNVGILANKWTYYYIESLNMVHINFS